MTARLGAPALPSEADHCRSPSARAQDTPKQARAPARDDDDDAGELDELLSLGLDCFEVDSL